MYDKRETKAQMRRIHRSNAFCSPSLHEPSKFHADAVCISVQVTGQSVAETGRCWVHYCDVFGSKLRFADVFGG